MDGYTSICLEFYDCTYVNFRWRSRRRRIRDKKREKYKFVGNFLNGAGSVWRGKSNSEEEHRRRKGYFNIGHQPVFHDRRIRGQAKKQIKIIPFSVDEVHFQRNWAIGFSLLQVVIVNCNAGLWCSRCTSWVARGSYLRCQNIWQKYLELYSYFQGRKLFSVAYPEVL